MAVNFNNKNRWKAGRKVILDGKNKGRLQRQTEVLSIKGKPFLGFPLCGDRCLYIIKIHKNPPRNLTKLWKWKFLFNITFDQKFKKRWKLHLKTESGNCATVLVVLYNNVHVSEDKHADKRLNATYWGDNSSGVSPFNKLFHSLNHHFHWESVLVHGGIHHPKRQLTCAR